MEDEEVGGYISLVHSSVSSLYLLYPLILLLISKVNTKYIMLFSVKETKKRKRINKKIENNYYRALELFRNIGAIKFAEYLEDKYLEDKNNGLEDIIYKLFPSIYDKKLEEKLELSKKYIRMGERSCDLVREVEKEEDKYKDIRALVREDFIS